MNDPQRLGACWCHLLLCMTSVSAQQLYIGLNRNDVATAPQARPSMMLPNAPGRGGKNPALAWKCFDEGTRPVGFFSLASLVDYPTPPAATPSDFVHDETNPVFDSRSTALERCRSYWPTATLASPFTAQRNVVRDALSA